jgi:hypothetical protein
MSSTKLRFASDQDLVRFEPRINEVWTKLDSSGNVLNNWDIAHGNAMDEIDRKMRARKDVPEQFELGRVGFRTREQLRDCAAHLALHYIFVFADGDGAPDAFYPRRAAYHREMAMEILNEVSLMIDYDLDNDGAINEIEKSQPFPVSFVRG